MVPATPAPSPEGPVSVFVDTPEAVSKTRKPRCPKPTPQPSRHSARIAGTRAGMEGAVPTVPEMAEQLAAIRNLDPGTSSTPSLPPSGSRFSILDAVPLGHLDQVAQDSGVVFRGERGPRLEQIAAIKAKGIYEGVLASSRAQVERERAGTLVPEGPEQSVRVVSNKLIGVGDE